ncbi:hypothetical protein SCUP234_05399 [Seiridium cupressi]
MEAPSSMSIRLPRPRRVATEPPPFQPLQRSLSVSSTSSRPGTLGASRLPDESIETLYNHPSVKIIAFTSSQRTLGGSDFLAEPKPGSLSPYSQLERTIAVGPFRIYRAPGSVAFLSCGSALQPILPKSQCWCIDEADSRFVLQIRRPQYWRIEVPLSDPEDVHRALILREVFDSILLFEKTECPFERSFTVALPERPQTPVKKKPWTPVGKNLISSPFLVADASPTPPAPEIVMAKRRRKTDVSKQESEVVVEARIGNVADSNSAADTTEIETDHPHAISEKAAIFTENAAAKSEASADPVAMAQGDLEKSSEPPNKTQPVQHITPGTTLMPVSSERKAQHENEVQPEVQHIPEFSKEPNLVVPAVSRGSVTNIPAKAHDVSPAPIRPTASLPACAEPPKPYPDETEALVAERETSSSHIGSSNLPPSLSPPARVREVEKPEASLASPNEGSNPPAEEVIEDTKDDGPRSFEGAGSVGAVSLKKKRISRILAGRSVTLPPQLTLVTSPPSKPAQHSTIKEPQATPPPPPPIEFFEPVPEAASPNGSTDSFHSVQSWHSPITPIPPSPPSSSHSPPPFPYPHDNIVLPTKGMRNMSSANVTPTTDTTLVPSSAGATVHALDTDSPSFLSPADNFKDTSHNLSRPVEATASSSAIPERPGLQHRPRTTNMSISRRALSPLPPAANLFSPTVRQPPANRLTAVRNLPSAIIHKTVEILLSPPSHLVNLMLKVAAKIAAGEWRGLVLGLGEGGESIPVHWDYSDGELSSWEDDDDYKFSIGRLAKTQSASSNASQEYADLQSNASVDENKNENENDRSWEVD